MAPEDTGTVMVASSTGAMATTVATVYSYKREVSSKARDYRRNSHEHTITQLQSHKIQQFQSAVFLIHIGMLYCQGPSSGCHRVRAYSGVGRYKGGLRPPLSDF